MKNSKAPIGIGAFRLVYSLKQFPLYFVFLLRLRHSVDYINIIGV